MPEQALPSLCEAGVLKKLQDKPKDAFNIRHQRANPLRVTSTPGAQAAELADKETEGDYVIVAH